MFAFNGWARCCSTPHAKVGINLASASKLRAGLNMAAFLSIGILPRRNAKDGVALEQTPNNGRFFLAALGCWAGSQETVQKLKEQLGRAPTPEETRREATAKSTMDKHLVRAALFQLGEELGRVSRQHSPKPPKLGGVTNSARRSKRVRPTQRKQMPHTATQMLDFCKICAARHQLGRRWPKRSSKISSVASPPPKRRRRR